MTELMGFGVRKYTGGVGCTVGAVVFSCVGFVVGAVVGCFEGFAVGLGVGTRVGANVGCSEGFMVGPRDGFFVRTTILLVGFDRIFVISEDTGFGVGDVGGK